MASDALQRTLDVAREQADALAAWRDDDLAAYLRAEGSIPAQVVVRLARSDPMPEAPAGAPVVVEHIDLRPLAVLGPVLARCVELAGMPALGTVLARLVEPVASPRDPGPPSRWAPFVVATLRRVRAPLVIGGGADETQVRAAIEQVAAMPPGAPAPRVTLVRGRLC